MARLQGSSAGSENDDAIMPPRPDPENLAVSPLTKKKLQPVQVPPSREVPSLAQDVLAGLFSSPRQLPPKYFYDARGSMLFDRICRTPEYYPTRTETTLLRRHAGDIAQLARPTTIVEFGSGSYAKARLILGACAEQGRKPVYAPFDVCADVLTESGLALRREFPWLEIEPLVGDFTAGLEHVPLQPGRRLLMFLGGTIGNFDEGDAEAFLTEVRSLMHRDDCLLLGADRVKSPAMLHAAYNDRDGITAQFNLNVLAVLNAELGSDFELSNFEHRALYNPEAERIEMYLDSVVDQRIGFRRLGRTLELQAGESILTEISRKFTDASLLELLNAAGLRVLRHFESDGPLFSLVLAARADV